MSATEILAVILAVAASLQAVALVGLCLCVPIFCWRVMRLEDRMRIEEAIAADHRRQVDVRLLEMRQDLQRADDLLDEVCKVAGVETTKEEVRQ